MEIRDFCGRQIIEYGNTTIEDYEKNLLKIRHEVICFVTDYFDGEVRNLFILNQEPFWNDGKLCFYLE